MGCATCSGSASGVVKISVEQVPNEDEETIQNQDRVINCIDQERISIQSSEPILHVGSSYISHGELNPEMSSVNESPVEMMIRREVEKKKRLDKEYKAMMRMKLLQEKSKKAPTLDVSSNQLYQNRISSDHNI